MKNLTKYVQSVYIKIKIADERIQRKPKWREITSSWIARFDIKILPK